MKTRSKTIETVQAYLERNRAARMTILSQKQKIGVIRDEINMTEQLFNSAVSDEMKSARPKDLIDKLKEIEEECLQAINQSILIYKECNAIIKAADNPTYRTLLELRYLSFLTWGNIAEIMSYDTRYIHKLHNQALYSISEAVIIAQHRQGVTPLIRSHVCTVENKEKKV